jgi:hypothetical protein
MERLIVEHKETGRPKWIISDQLGWYQFLHDYIISGQMRRDEQQVKDNYWNQLLAFYDERIHGTEDMLQ